MFFAIVALDYFHQLLHSSQPATSSLQTAR